LGDAPTEIDRNPVADAKQFLERGSGPRAPAADSIFLQEGHAPAKERAALIDVWMASVPIRATKCEYAEERKGHDIVPDSNDWR